MTEGRSSSFLPSTICRPCIFGLSFLSDTITILQKANLSEIKQLIPQLFAITAQLETAAPGRKFTPDGHTVGSIGEVLAACDYGLRLATASTEGVDAWTSDDVEVEIKATCREKNQVVCLRSCKKGLHLLVLWIHRDGGHETIFNGPADLAWKNAGPMQKTGQRPIGFKKLLELQAQVPLEQQLKRVGD